ncbi:hypothetical protein CK203_049184 [Vitis vinifera]|uniref:Uncharacterized protein n=1 Tax=Vitis vinifera TaxID=29760 RepID=A0A438GV31_VITVI|nr:hypothetical protein CK203_049184 [Vitis vinifera]
MYKRHPPCYCPTTGGGGGRAVLPPRSLPPTPNNFGSGLNLLSGAKRLWTGSMVLSSRLTTTLLLPVKVCQRGRCLNRCCWHSRLILGIVRVSDAGGFFSSQPYSHRGKATNCRGSLEQENESKYRKLEFCEETIKRGENVLFGCLGDAVWFRDIQWGWSCSGVSTLSRVWIWLRAMEEAKVNKVALGGRCWFEIKFGVKILARLLEGVEECHVGKAKGPFRRVWSEGGRGYSLMLRSNKVGRFLLCSAVCIEEKRSSLVFPERNAAHGGWKILASKFRSGVASELRPEEELKELMRLWVEKEKRGRELPKSVSYAEMLERGKSFVGDEVGSPFRRCAWFAFTEVLGSAGLGLERLLVQSCGRKERNQVLVVDRDLVYSGQQWWEFGPYLSTVAPKGTLRSAERCERELSLTRNARFSNLVKGKALGPSDLLGYGSTGDAREPLDCGSAVKLVQQGLSLADPLVQAKLQELMEWNSGVDKVLVAEAVGFLPLFDPFSDWILLSWHNVYSKSRDFHGVSRVGVPATKILLPRWKVGGPDIKYSDGFFGKGFGFQGRGGGGRKCFGVV